MPNIPANPQGPKLPSPRRDYWMFEFTREQAAKFDEAMHARGVRVDRHSEHTTRDLQSQHTETRVDGTLERGEDFAEFTLKGVPVVADEQGTQINPGGSVLTVRVAWIPSDEPRVRRLAEEIALAFPGTTVMSSESLNQTLSRMDWWKSVAGVGCFILVAVIVLGVLALAFYGAVRLWF